jgi:hypothetical protein
VATFLGWGCGGGFLRAEYYFLVGGICWDRNCGFGVAPPSRQSLP